MSRESLDRSRIQKKKLTLSASSAKFRLTVMADTEEVMLGGTEGHSRVNSKEVSDNGPEVLKFTVDQANKIIDEQEHLKKKLQEKVQSLKGDVTASEEIARESKNKLKQAQEQIVAIKDQLLSLNESKVKAAEKIATQFNQIKRIYIEEPTDISNQLFKWFLAVAYNESFSKFDFPNFIHETINRDKGVDFANRLKGLRAFDLGKDEAAVTSATLSQEEAIKKEMQEFNPSYITAVNDLFTYIKTVNEIIKTRDELKKLESTYQSAFKKSDIDSAHYLKAFTRYESAKNDLALSEKAIKTFTKVLEIAQNTQALCQNKF